ncbi:MAG TPA: zf-HC2 domain-containing protein [Acidimicrobiia bacterium]|nr:zf-HC2 domain-containing protein [Acidimicrobiia bacterium]
MRHLEDLLSALLDGELASDDRTDVAAHLRACDGCRLELADLAVARTALRSLPLLELPAALVVSRDDAVVVPLRRRPSVWAASAAAAMVLVGLTATGGEPAPAADIDTLAEQHTARVVVDPGFATIRMTVEE